MTDEIFNAGTDIKIFYPKFDRGVDAVDPDDPEFALSHTGRKESRAHLFRRRNFEIHRRRVASRDLPGPCFLKG